MQKKRFGIIFQLINFLNVTCSMQESNTRQSVLHIHLSSLSGGKTEVIEHVIASSLLDIDDEKLVFGKDVSINGQAYLVDNWLILQFDIWTQAETICGVCNEACQITCDISGSRCEVDLEEIKGGKFDYLPFIRESILLEVPFYPLCGQDVCTRREEIEPYLSKRSEERPA